MPIRIVQPVSHDPFVGNVEPEIIDPHVLFESIFLPQKHARLQGGRLAREQGMDKVVERVPGIDDIFNDQYVFSRDVCPEIHDEANGARRRGVLSVGGKRYEIDASRNGEEPGEVGKEYEAPPEHPDQEKFPCAFIIRGHLSGQLLHPTPDLLLGNENRWFFLIFPDFPAPSPGFARHPFCGTLNLQVISACVIFSQFRETKKTGDRGTGSVGQPIEGNVVDVVAGKIFPGRIFHENGVITKVAPSSGTFSGFLLPGFLDAHIHIDSSLLCPSRFAEAVVPHGTTGVITDPHEIANVMGLAGIFWMRKDAASVPLRVFFTAPSCVPATPFETSGASLGLGDVEALLREPDVVALGEVMDYPAAIARDADVMAKIGAANHAGKPIDGHCPMVTGEDLRRYASLGISTDHECTRASEALEKHALGMRILVRDGTAAKNVTALVPFALKHDFFLVSDDKLAPDLIESHLDGSLARAVSLGIDPLHAVRAVTIRPALHYRLPLGAIAAGRMADIVKVRDLSGFFVEEVFIGGTQVAKEGRAYFTAKPLSMSTAFPVSPRRPDDFAVPAPGPSVTARVIGLVRDEILTRSETATLKVKGGRVIPDRNRDILLLSVVNRYRNAPVATGFVTGFGLKRGAMASSVAHDAHNIISVGDNPEDMSRAVNTLIRESGGLCYAAGETSTLLPLQIAGLMSTDPPGDLRSRLSHLRAKTKEAGCALDSPFMTLSFLSLLVIPHLKIGDRGLFDVSSVHFVDPILAAGPDHPAGNRS